MTGHVLTLLCAILTPTLQDIYLHNPRGSNNRLSERTRARTNGNRLFDSQNNNRGGYNVGNGSLSYVERSVLQIEWTLQHACGKGSGVHCEVILQYACDRHIHDGGSVKTIPESVSEEDGDFGMHEDRRHYQLCRKTRRNKGVFTADQRLRGNSAQFTRQNPNGQRRGLECPEERDYYPYWRPSPWQDIVILTNDVGRCPLYQSASSESKGECLLESLNDVLDGQVPITQEECEEFVDKNGKKGHWIQRAASSPVPCQETQFSRDNHLGDVIGGDNMAFNWTLPQAEKMKGNCVLRIRYNVSTGDYPGWLIKVGDTVTVGKDNGVPRDTESGRRRGYVFANNPTVKIFDDLDLDLQLAINTAQFGRVFQDRSHVFHVVKRDSLGVPNSAHVHNVNIRGRRGNIVQVYPAVEYDFVPNTLMMPRADWVHFQWTGSDSTPDGDGQGRRGTDRSNLILQRHLDFVPQSHANLNVCDIGHWATNYPSELDSYDALLGFSKSLRKNLALAGSSQSPLLDDAPAYFDAKPQPLHSSGNFHFFSTRNNDFSNRNQKGRLIVVSGDVGSVKVGAGGGSLRLKRASILVHSGTFDQSQIIRAEVLDEATFDDRLASSQRQLVFPAVSPYLVIHPETELTSRAEGLTIFISLDKVASGRHIKVLASDTSDLTLWTSLPFLYHSNHSVEFHATSGGVFYVGDGGVAGSRQSGVIVAIVVCSLLLMGLGLFILRKKNTYTNLPPTIAQRT